MVSKLGSFGRDTQRAATMRNGDIIIKVNINLINDPLEIRMHAVRPISVIVVSLILAHYHNV